MADAPQPDAIPADIGRWGMANAMAQKFQMENSMLAKHGMTKQGEGLVDLGSKIVNNTTYSPASSIPNYALAAVALLGTLGGLGGMGLLAFKLIPTPASPPAGLSGSLSPGEPRIVEGLLDWEFNGDALTVKPGQ